MFPVAAAQRPTVTTTADAPAAPIRLRAGLVPSGDSTLGPSPPPPAVGRGPGLVSAWRHHAPMGGPCVTVRAPPLIRILVEPPRHGSPCRRNCDTCNGPVSRQGHI